MTIDTTKHKGKPVRIIEREEPETRIKLEDGSTIVGRIIIQNVHAIYDLEGNRVFNDDGSPMYAYNNAVMCYIEHFESVPEGTKRN